MNFANIFVVIISFFPILDICRAQKLNSFGQTALKMHNKYREKHKSQKLTMSVAMSNLATDCAQHYANIGEIDYSCPEDAEDFGMNVYIDHNPGTAERDFIADAIEEWYGEGKGYNYNDTLRTGDEEEAADHFTQVVWGSTKFFGFGIGTGNGNMVAVALYKPAGNVAGKYGKNVFTTEDPNRRRPWPWNWFQRGRSE